MIEADSIEALSRALRSGIEHDHSLLDEMLSDMRTLKLSTRRIHPRSATAISLVGTDGGNHSVSFDPFLVQIIRVVDSSDNEYCLEVITPSSDFAYLNEEHIGAGGKGLTPLGRMIEDLGLSSIQDLSPVFVDSAEERSPSWVQVYREMHEWAVLLDLIRSKQFGSDTVIIYDGFLRSKMFRRGLFGKYAKLVSKYVDNQFRESRRRIFVIGIAKRSKVLQKYRLAMAVEGVLRSAYPAYVALPLKIEAKVYRWSEYATGGGEGELFVAGQMFLVKFGKSPYAPIWAVDILTGQANDASTILGYVLADCEDGFPIPHYPQCLQRAHEKAALVDFDMDILQDQICDAIRERLGDKSAVVDELTLQEVDPSGRRYR